MESKHTKTPWMVVNSGGAITAEFKDGYELICTLETVPLKITPHIEANAHHIVKCVNTHDELMEILMEMKNAIYHNTDISIISRRLKNNSLINAPVKQD